MRLGKEGEAGSVNEQLKEKLQQWRMERFKKENMPAYTIMPQSALLEIAMYVPKTKGELLSIKGFGEKRYEKYGEQILEICRNF